MFLWCHWLALYIIFSYFGFMCYLDSWLCYIIVSFYFIIIQSSLKVWHVIKRMYKNIFSSTWIFCKLFLILDYNFCIQQRKVHVCSLNIFTNQGNYMCIWYETVSNSLRKGFENLKMQIQSTKKNYELYYFDH